MDFKAIFERDVWPIMQQQSLAAMQGVFDSKAAQTEEALVAQFEARRAELETEFEAKRVELNAELQAHYQAHIAAKEQELEAQANAAIETYRAESNAAMEAARAEANAAIAAAKAKQAELEQLLLIPERKCPALDFSFVAPDPSIDIEVSEGGLMARRTSCWAWQRTFGSLPVHLVAGNTPILVRFRVLAMGEKVLVGNGPNLGFATLGTERISDNADDRDRADIWTYRASDGFLLAPTPESIVGQDFRAPARPGSEVAFLLHPDGHVSLRIDFQDQGVIFQKLPTSLRPVVEMNSFGSQVLILR